MNFHFNLSDVIEKPIALGQTMSEKRVMRKLKKLAARISTKIESVRDEMDDLEIEFELIQQHINKLEIMAKNQPVANDEITVTVEEEEADLDLENSSAVPAPKKF